MGVVDFADDFFFVFGFCPWVDMEVNCLLNLLAIEYGLVWGLLFQDCIPLASLGQQAEGASAAAQHKQQQQERDHAHHCADNLAPPRLNETLTYCISFTITNGSDSQRCQQNSSVILFCTAGSPVVAHSRKTCNCARSCEAVLLR